MIKAIRIFLIFLLINSLTSIYCFANEKQEKDVIQKKLHSINQKNIQLNKVNTSNKKNDSFEQTGMASWYGKKFHGRKTASGDYFNMHLMTAAHKTLPLPSYVKVTNLSNNKSITVKVNDRGPYSKKRIIDLSYAAAKELGFINKGVTKVKIEKLNNN